MNETMVGDDEVVLADDDDIMLAEPEVKRQTRLSQTTRWRMRKAGKFPELVLGRYLTQGQIREWKAQLVAEAEAKAAAQRAPPRAPGRPRKAESMVG